MKNKVYNIPVVIIMYDNQDGGYTVQIFNNEDELIKNHRKVKEMTPELREEILSGEDEYENGYVDRGLIQISVDKNGVARLDTDICLGVGQ